MLHITMQHSNLILREHFFEGARYNSQMTVKVHYIERPLVDYDGKHLKKSHDTEHFTVACRKYTHPQKYTHPRPHFHWKLLQMVIYYSKVFPPNKQVAAYIVMKSVVYMYVWASSWKGRSRGALQSDHARIVLTIDTTAQDASDASE